MKTFIDIGSSPCDEKCIQITEDDYSTTGFEECKKFKAQIERAYPVPRNCSVGIKRCPYEDGYYYSVCVYFDDEDENGITWAYAVEADDEGKLIKWDAI